METARVQVYPVSSKTLTIIKFLNGKEKKKELKKKKEKIRP